VSFTLTDAKGFDSMENLVVGLIALALFAYLLFAMLKPEKF
jgi:K+-transporting ATPase KdpF subunit